MTPVIPASAALLLLDLGSQQRVVIVWICNIPVKDEDERVNT